MKGIYKYIDNMCVDVILENCCTYLTKDQHPPSNLVVYSTIQCSTIEIII